MTQVPSIDVEESETPPKDRVASFGAHLARLPNGDRALLRRANPDRSSEADGIVMGLMHRAGIPIDVRPEVMASWRTVAHIAALLSGSSGSDPHDPRARLGSLFAENGVSETRLLALVSPSSSSLATRRLIRTVRVLVQKGVQALDLRHIRSMAASEEGRRSDAMSTVARDYYSKQNRMKTQ